jgi:hypothetical protein
VADPAADIARRVTGVDDLRRLRELADELTADQRLVLACQVALDMDCQQFCARFGWSAEKFRKVAQRARARLRVLVADYETGERCRGLADDLAAYVAHVAEGDQSERVRRHLSNCPACAHTARELERVARGVGALLPLPPATDPETVHRLGVVGRGLGRLLPFWDTGASAAAIKAGAAGAAAAGGTGAVTAGGGSLLGLGAAKVGIVALCAAGAASGYVVCDQIGLFAGPVPRDRDRATVTAAAAHKQRAKHTPSAAVARTPAPVAQTIRRAAATGGQRRSAASPPASSSSAGQASSEFGFEGAGAAQSSTRGSRPTSLGSARAASDGTQAGQATSSPSAKRSTGSAHRASSEFGFE